MGRNIRPGAFRSVAVATLLAAALSGVGAAVAEVVPEPAPPDGVADGGPSDPKAEIRLDPHKVKVGDKVKIVLREINQKSGAIVFTASKAAYGTVRSVERLDVDGKENLVFEIAPYGSDGKTVLKYDKETGQTMRVEPTVRFGTLQIEKIVEMPSDEDMRRIASFREVGDEGALRLLPLDTEKAEVDRRIQRLRADVRTLRQAIADHEASVLGATKPVVPLLRDKGGTSRADSGADAAAQEIVDARKRASEAAIIRLKFRLSQKEDDLREEMDKAAEYGIAGTGDDDLADLTPGERRILLDSRVKTLGREIRTIKEAIVNQEASALSATKPTVTQLRDKGGTSRADSGADAAAQEIVDARKRASEAAIIRLKARLADKEDELRVVRENLAKLDR